MSVAIVAQEPDEGNFVYLIPVLLNGRPWRFVRRLDGTDANRIEIETDERPTITLNGLPFSMAETVVN